MVEVDHRRIFISQVATSHRANIMLRRRRESAVARTVLIDVKHFNLRLFCCVFTDLLLCKGQVVVVLNVRMLVETYGWSVTIDIGERVRVLLFILVFTDVLGISLSVILSCD